MVENIQSKDTLGGHFIYDITIIKHKEYGHHHQDMFGRYCERGLITLKEPQSGLNFGLQIINVKQERK